MPGERIAQHTHVARHQRWQPVRGVIVKRHKFGMVWLQHAANNAAFEEGADDLRLIAVGIGPLKIAPGVQPDQALNDDV